MIVAQSPYNAIIVDLVPKSQYGFLNIKINLKIK